MSSRGVLRLLRMLLPAGTGDAALADLERELTLRRRVRGKHWTDGWWLAREGLALALHLCVARPIRGAALSLVGFRTELLQASRGLARSPGLSLAVVAVLALGVGAPTATYSLLMALGRTLPVDDADELVSLSYRGRDGFLRSLTLEHVRTVRERPGVLGDVAAYAPGAWDLVSEGREPQRVIGAEVTPDLLEVLGEEPQRGRGFTAGDVDQPVVLVGGRLWRNRFGADPSLVGGIIRVNGEPRTVVGILPDHLRFPDGADLWVPLRWPEAGSTRRYGTVARLPDDVPIERAEQEIAGLAVYPSDRQGSDPGGHLTVRRPGDVFGTDAGRRFAIAMLAFITSLLLVASSNVANLLLCRAIARRHDIAVRTALGASRARIVAIHLMEAGLVSLLGGAIGVVVAVRATRFVAQRFVGWLEWWQEIRVDTGMLAFAVGLVLTAALIAGIVPALQATRGDPRAGLGGGGRGGGDFRLSRLSARLVVLEVMFSAALLAQAFFMADAFFGWRVAGGERFESEDVLVAAYDFRPGERTAEGERQAFHRRFLERAAARPGVLGVAIFSPFPGARREGGSVVEAREGLPRRVYDRDGTLMVHVSPGAFDLLNVPVVRGRDLTWSDGGVDPPAVLVNEAFARRVFPGRDPLGKQVRFEPPGGAGEVVATVVGLVPTVAVLSWKNRHADAIYMPLSLGAPRDTYVMLRGMRGGNSLSLLPELRTVLTYLDADKPLHSVGRLDEMMRRQVPERVWGGLFAVAGLAALLIAGTGLYAVMAFAVGRRTRELGVRVTLGATPSRVVWETVRRALLQLVQGLALGVLLTNALAPMLIGGDSARRDPKIYAVVVAALLLTGVAAAVVPSLRAVRVQPTAALRAD